ncbi:MAG TPA: type II toxin-antitoxin system PemK/MazF family toxin [Blastocatellia bacterium]|nr:type II toxin-antitoxin system PemK/MazF family toxin [Blastocatellia bacterium]
MKVGDLYWVELPVRGGHAQAGRRPAIIVQQTSNLPTVLVVPITSQQDALRFPGTVLIESTKENGLHHDSVALVFQLTAIDKRRVADRLGVASEEVMQKIWEALDDLTGRG